MQRTRLALSTLSCLVLLSGACGDDDSSKPGDDAGMNPGDGDTGDGDSGDGDGDAGPGDGDTGDGDTGDGDTGDGDTGDGDAGPGDGDGDASPGDGDGDGDGDSVAACIAQATTERDSRTEVFTLHGEGVNVGFARHVDPEGFGTSGTTIWLAQRFAVARGETSACVSDKQQLDYTISHHNFDDVFTATADGVTYLITQRQENYEQPTFFALTAKDGDTTLWGPVPLTVDTCRELLNDEDCKERYK